MNPPNYKIGDYVTYINTKGRSLEAYPVDTLSGNYFISKGTIGKVTKISKGHRDYFVTIELIHNETNARIKVNMYAWRCEKTNEYRIYKNTNKT